MHRASKGTRRKGEVSMIRRLDEQKQYFHEPVLVRYMLGADMLIIRHPLIFSIVCIQCIETFIKPRTPV